jgi:predicted DNA-binding transcriptional regulator AlpA
MIEIRPTVDIHGAGEALGPQGKAWSRNTIKRRMAADSSFPRPFDDGGRLQWFLDELLAWKESRPRRIYAAVVSVLAVGGGVALSFANFLLA